MCCLQLYVNWSLPLLGGTATATSVQSTSVPLQRRPWNFLAPRRPQRRRRRGRGRVVPASVRVSVGLRAVERVRGGLKPGVLVSGTIVVV